MNSLWLLLAALAALAVSYRCYAAFLAARVAVLNDERATPAHRMKDGVDYHPTHKWVLFGHHFAAIAGPGPLVGPVLAAQWGYFPGFAWLIIGACLAGAVHDFVILWASVREDGLSLPRLARRSIGPVSGMTASLATLFIVVITLASVAAVVVHALSHSAWGMFTIIVTIPAALLTGLWMYKIRPGKIAEASALGVAIILLGVFLGRPVAESSWGSVLILDPKTLCVVLPVYAAITSILPVWVLMCPRDYLSSYMKIGVMIVLTAGIFVVHPELKMPAATPFISGGGPVLSGPVWPFLCITVMCGAISGFHALVASGTTPKMISRESSIKPVGYGAMLLECLIAVTALIAACALEPGDYFAINSPAPAYQRALREQAGTGWDIAHKDLRSLEASTRETLEARPGGAVTLAVGMARVFSKLPGMTALMSYWYHFVIMFEALFILTLLETGTRVARFVFQDTVAEVFKKPRKDQNPGAPAVLAAPAAGRVNWGLNIGMSVLVCFLWGYLLYRGDLGMLWKMLGIVNQLLAAIALAVGTTYLLLHTRRRLYALCTALPFVFVVVTTYWASILSIGGWWAEQAVELDSNKVFMLRLVCALSALMLVLVTVLLADALRRWVQILRGPARRDPAHTEASAPECEEVSLAQ